MRKPFKPKPRTVGISNEIAARAAATRARRQAEKEGREEGPDPAFPDRVDREPDQVISAVTQLAKRKELLTHATHLRDTKHLGHRCPLPEPDPLEDLEHPGAKGKRRKRARASAQEQPKTKNVWTPEKEPFLVVDYRYRQRGKSVLSFVRTHLLTRISQICWPHSNSKIMGTCVDVQQSIYEFAITNNEIETYVTTNLKNTRKY